MPVYEYICEHCHERFELLRSFSKADEPAPCPVCEHEGRRSVVTTFACVSKGAGGETHSVGGGGCASCSAASCAGCKR